MNGAKLLNPFHHVPLSNERFSEKKIRSSLITRSSDQQQVMICRNCDFFSLPKILPLIVRGVQSHCSDSFEANAAMVRVLCPAFGTRASVRMAPTGSGTSSASRSGVTCST